MLSLNVLVFLSLTTAVFYCDSASTIYTITFSQYTTIQIGWTQAQLTKLVGSPGDLVSQTGTGNTAITILQYTGPQSSYSAATFTFQGGILSSKSQSGLDTGNYTITLQQYTAIQMGWTRAQVASLVGSAGSATFESGTGNTATISVQYSAAGPTYGLAQFVFTGGQLVSKFEYGLDTSVNNKITFQQYTTIQIGWTQSQIAELLGGNGTIISQSEYSGSPNDYTTVQYTGSQSSYSTATFTFQGGILSSKSQNGLDTGNYTITLQQYTAIQMGWTRARVTSLVASTGSATFESGTGNTAEIYVQYSKTGPTYGFVQLVFLGGQLVSKYEYGLDTNANDPITLQQYKTIKIGWTQNRITKFLGGSGTIISQSEYSGLSTEYTVVKYTGSQSSYSSATFNFQGDILSSKSQSGLDTGNYTMTKQQYVAIQIGYTRARVTSLVGSAGNALFETGTGTTATVTVQYSAAGTSYGFVQLGFTGGKLSSKYEFGFQ